MRTGDLVNELRDAELRGLFVEHDLKREMSFNDAHLTPRGNRAMAANFRGHGRSVYRGPRFTPLSAAPRLPIILL